MRLKTLHVRNFGPFEDAVIEMAPHTVLVGQNGVGKSSVLKALNVFFGGGHAGSVHRDDFHRHRTDRPIEIEATFTDIADEAVEALSAYVRNGELRVVAVVAYDATVDRCTIKHVGERLALEAFAPYFSADKEGAPVTTLRGIYQKLREAHPDLPSQTTKAAMTEALRVHESEHPDECRLIRSEDNFYGVNSQGMLARFVRWVYVPAVKDADDEGREARNTALGRLVEHLVEGRQAMDEEIENLRNRLRGEYAGVVQRHAESLDALGRRLEERLRVWSHTGVDVRLEWEQDPEKSVAMQPPRATLKAGENGFLGDVKRLGHGLQRSYLIALLQEAVNLDSDNRPARLLLGCEEPELYQHPPQARYLASVLRRLSETEQVIVTTHSPYFVSGDALEGVRRVVHADPGTSGVVATTFTKIEERLQELTDAQLPRIRGRAAKIHQALQPAIAEMMFARVVVLVEGLEDAAYLSAVLELAGLSGDFRRLGCHIVPVNGKSALVTHAVIAESLAIPTYVLFDSDGDCVRDDYRRRHQSDNETLLRIFASEGHADPFPVAVVRHPRCTQWPSNIGTAVAQDIPPDIRDRAMEAARVAFEHEPALEKNTMFIAQWLADVYDQGHKCELLEVTCQDIIEFAESQAPAAIA